MGIELERHPPERGALPVVVAGGCCTTCCCCCCCCAYVPAGLAGAAIGSAMARAAGGERADQAIGWYWKLVGVAFAASIGFGLLGFAVHGLWIASLGMLLLGLPAMQVLASLVLVLSRDPEARRAGVRITLAWLMFTLLGVLLTALVFASCSEAGSK